MKTTRLKTYKRLHKLIDSYDPIDIASQLTLIEFTEYYNKITFRMLINKSLQPKNRTLIPDNTVINAWISHIDKTTIWTAQEVGLIFQVIGISACILSS